MLPTEIITARDNLKACIREYIGIYQIGVSTSRPQRMLDELMASIGSEVSRLQEAIAMQEQNARAFSIREKELVDQNDALRKANSSIHTARLDYLTDIKNLKDQVRKLGQDVQGLMNPVEIYGGTTEPAYTLRFIDPEQCKPKQCNCNCNSCKWKRHQETIKSTQVPGYGIGGTDCFVCGQFHGGLPCPTMTPMGNNYRG